MGTLDFFNHISFISSWNEKFFRKTLYIKSKHTLLRSITLFENRAIHGILWNDTVELGSPQVTMRRMRVARWIHKATTHPDYGIHIAFPLQQWLHERDYMSRYMYVASPVSHYKLRKSGELCITSNYAMLITNMNIR